MSDKEQPLTAETVFRMMKQLPPKERYRLADFMSFSDDMMCCPDIGEALDEQDVWSEDGKSQIHELHMGMNVKSIKVKVNFESDGDDGWSYKDHEILDD